MRRIFFSLWFSLCLVTVSIAQQEVFSFPCGVMDMNILRAIADDEGNTCILVNHSGLLYFYTIPATRDTFYESTFLEPFMNNNIIITAVINTTKTFVFLYSKTTKRKLNAAFVIRKASGTVTVIDDINLDEPVHGSLAKIVSDNNAAYFIYSYKKKQQIGVLRLDSYDNTTYKIFPVEMPETGLYFQAADFKKINLNLPNTIYQSHFYEKVYVEDNNRLVFTFDISREHDIGNTKDYGSTKILSLDWNNGTSTYLNVPADLDGKKYLSNSFLFDDKLFRLSLHGKELNLSVINPVTNEVIKKYYFHNDTISIQSTPVVIEGARTVFEDRKRYVDDQDKILKKINDGIPAISVYSYKDSLLVASIGSYRDPKSNSTYYFAAAGPAMMIVPGPGIFSTGEGSSTTFKSILNRSGCEFVPVAYSPNSLDRIFDFFYEQRKETAGPPITYQYGNDVNFGYIDTKNKMFHILSLEK